MPESFPMLDGPPVPPVMAEIVYEVYVSIYGHDDFLADISEQGGFSYANIKSWMAMRHEAIEQGRWKGP